MSSGTVKNNYHDLSIDKVELESFPQFNKEGLQKNKFNFISELMALLYKNKTFTGSFRNISNLVILALNEEKPDLCDQINHRNIDDYLKILNMIRSALTDKPELTHEQKFNYCTIERFFMKLYLKEFLTKK